MIYSNLFFVLISSFIAGLFAGNSRLSTSLTGPIIIVVNLVAAVFNALVVAAHIAG